MRNEQNGIYVNEANRQLNNQKYYSRNVPNSRKADLCTAINEILGKIHDKGYISSEQYDFLNAKECNRDRNFYLLPKVHKPKPKWPNPYMPEGHPIVGDCTTESRRVSDFIHFFLKPLANKHPSYHKDTPDFLSNVRNHSFMRCVDMGAYGINIGKWDYLYSV